MSYVSQLSHRLQHHKEEKTEKSSQARTSQHHLGCISQYLRNSRMKKRRHLCCTYIYHLLVFATNGILLCWAQLLHICNWMLAATDNLSRLLIIKKVHCPFHDLSIRFILMLPNFQILSLPITPHHRDKMFY